jgi:hypothetical protein
MFRADAYHTVVSPIFGTNFSCNLELITNKNGRKQRQKIDNIDVNTLPYSESIITLALVKVSEYKENRQIKLKQNLLLEINRKQHPGRGIKKQPLSEADILMATTIPGQIEAKKKKIALYKEYKTILENVIREFEIQFMEEYRKA